MTFKNAEPDTPFNVLITSASGKVPLIKNVRTALQKLTPDGIVLGGDSDSEVIGRYFVDSFWHMPTLEHLSTGDLITFCIDRHIKVIVPTRDGELPYFSRHRDLLEQNGINVMVSDHKAVETCNDKLEFFNCLKDLPSIRPIHTALQPDSRETGTWVVKEQYGAGTRKSSLNISRDEAKQVSGQLSHPVYQPFIPGKEFSVDMYMTKNAEPKGCIVRTRENIVRGESQVSVTVSRPDIKKICVDAAGHLGLRGHVLFQIIEDENSAGSLHLLECNCRFGGASSLSIAAGLDSFYWFFRECCGDDLSGTPFLENKQLLRQVRYPEDKITPMT